MADEMEVTLFREILLVPFVIEVADGGVKVGTKSLIDSVRHRLLTDPSKRWRRLDEPLLHLPEDRIPPDVTGARRARRLAGAYEEFVYFEPYVQDFLYAETASRTGHDRPLEIWQAEGFGHLEIDYDLNQRGGETGKSADAPSVSTFVFRLARCNLYLLSTGNALLAIELELEGKRGDGDDDTVRLGDALHLLESVRRMFPPFFSRAEDRHGDPDAGLHALYYPRRFRLVPHDGGQTITTAYEIEPEAIIAKVMGEGDRRLPKIVPLFEPWRRLLDPLTVRGYETERSRKPEVVLTQLGDDRAFVIAQIGVPNPHAIGEGDWVRLCYLDAPGNGLPYARHFLEGFERENCYDRFFSKNDRFYEANTWQTTRYLVCEYALVCVGKAAPAGMADKDFFRHVIGRHIRRQYFHLVFIALLQKTALKTLSDRLANSDTDDPEAVAALQEEVLGFTHRYWFEDISSQIQARELFGMLRRHMRLRELYAQLSQEVRERSALAAQRTSGQELEKQTRVADEAQRLNVIAAVGLAASVIVGFFGMNVLKAEPFMPAGRDVFWGVSLLMAGVFAGMFQLRADIIRLFRASVSARFILVAVPIAIGSCILLGCLGGP